MRAKTTMLRWVALLGIAALAPAGNPARADDAGAVLAGRTIATTWCANCHLVTAAQASGSDQAPPWSGIANRAGTTSETLHAFLAKPHGKMPDFKLGVTDIDNVTAYILSLKN